MTGKKLYLVDGMSTIFRAYHALPPLRNSKGLATNAVYGFTAMLRKLIHEQKPDYLGVALDLEGPTVRHAAYEKYKANRKVMPDDLAVQLPFIWKVCDVLRIPLLSHPQYEADDVIGTLARKAAQAGLISVIVTNDKDMYQLVSDQIFVLDTRNNSHLIDANKVEEKMGVPPQKVVELLGLWGDASDNIPGAPGIGEKGAKELIQHFGSIENCLRNYEQVARKTYRESLKNWADQIRQSRELVTIHTDLPIELDLDELIFSQPDREAAYNLFSELEFTSILKDYLISPPALVKYKEISDEAELSTALDKIRSHKSVGICVLPSSRDFVTARPLGLALSAGAETAVFVRMTADPKFNRTASGFLCEPGGEKIYFDLKREQLLLGDSNCIDIGSSQDIMLAAYLLDPNKGAYKLSDLCSQYLGIQVSELDEKQDGILSSEPLDLCCQQAEMINRLAAKLLPKLQAEGLEPLYREIELPLAVVLADMEKTGVKIDVPFLGKMSHQFEKEIDSISEKIYKLAGLEFNINSSRQLGEILFEKHQFPSLKRTQKTKNYSTDFETLEMLAENYELPKLILEYRQLSKLKSTYIDALPRLVHPDTGRVHTSYNQAGTATGRLSSREPNFQNIPIRSELGRKIRSAFVAEEGNLLMSADYSQIELRVMAHLSGDPGLVEAFNKAEDIHTRTAIEVFGMGAQFDLGEYRRRAKVINFALIYGQSAFGLAKGLKTSKSEAQKFIDSYFARYQGVKQWLESTLALARKAAAVKTLFGRVRPIKDINHSGRNLRGIAERAAINSPIQGTAADLIKIAMIKIHRALREQQLRTKLILQVHDELVFEVPEKEVSQVREIVKYEMENVCPMKVPLIVDIHVAKTWRDVK